MSGVFQDMDRKTALPLRLCLFINDHGGDLVSPPEGTAGDQGMVAELERASICGDRQERIRRMLGRGTDFRHGGETSEPGPSGWERRGDSAPCSKLGGTVIKCTRFSH